MLPTDNCLPKDHKHAQKVLHGLGLGYEKIHACKNNCMLFYKEHETLDTCPICNESRFKMTSQNRTTKIPQKVMRYLPLKPRLQRLYMSTHTATDMRWHKEKRVDDDVMRHPADGEAWKEFDRTFPEFAADPRNVRLGLATDGFNPYGVLNQHHSTWPIFAFPYNLPPWKCMKKEYMMMTVLITEDPGRSIDVYLRPLVDELKDLWTNGVRTYYKSTGRMFTLRAAVMWTVNDFPAVCVYATPTSCGTDMFQLRHDIVQVLCKFEMIFPPAFFTSMMHVMVHLPEEALLAGPVNYRWMYPIERLLGELKKSVRNRAKPEGSIIEAWVQYESLTFCGIQIRFRRARFINAILRDGIVVAQDSLNDFARRIISCVAQTVLNLQKRPEASFFPISLVFPPSLSRLSPPPPQPPPLVPWRPCRRRRHRSLIAVAVATVASTGTQPRRSRLSFLCATDPPAQSASAATAPALMNYVVVGPGASRAPASSASSVEQPARRRHRPTDTIDTTSTDGTGASGSQPGITTLLYCSFYIEI
ncbi:hypothetical protein L3X38_037224 [Prunus dulcis]|uniref:DUF4218 domain-containing protein n=1 Tax=Prunus dulcis TaxID=3755 RepID=A0AAD4V4N5_PRUDU|nr:hypothetical protein L3X38_037224 [Prunus dulcis]